MSSALIVLLYISFPMLCVLAIPPRARPAAFAERFVYGIALYEVSLMAIGLLLGLTNHLTMRTYVTCLFLTAFLLAVQSYRNGVRLHLIPSVRYFSTRRGAAALLLALLVALAFALELGFGALYGTRHSDGLWYHIPRVIFWMQQHNFDAWPTPSYAQIGLPVGADLVLGHKILMGEGWAGIGFVTLLLTSGAVACIYIAALDLRVSRWHALMSAMLFASFPTIGMRIWSVNSDIAAAFPALASYVALRRIKDIRMGLSVFLLLNGVAVACKPTVAPLVLLLGCVTLWQCRHKIIALRSVALPCAAAALAVALVIASYWPVYRAFSDFLGGEYSRAHRTENLSEFVHSSAMHSAHWVLEPLGYLTPFKKEWAVKTVKTVYNFLGAHFESLPHIWSPFPGQDRGYTGLASVLVLPILFAGLPSRVRLYAVLLFLLGYLPLSGMIRPQPFFTRYNVVLLAGVALLWGGTGMFQRGRRRWLLAGVVALNVCALLVVVASFIYMDKTKWSQPGGLYDYISDEDQETISDALDGRPLLVISAGQLGALLVDTNIEFPLRYVICPADGNWERLLRRVAGKSHWLALVHNGEKTIVPGPIWERPGSHACAAMQTSLLEDKLSAAGWRRYRSNTKVDLWWFGSPPEF